MIITTKIPQEEVETLNRRLLDYYGRTEPEGLPNYRIVWSDDQFEKRKFMHTDSGVELLYSEVRRVPKYRQWVQSKYILERLTVISNFEGSDLTEVLSYEPVYVFETAKGEALNPTWHAVNFIVANVNHNMAHTGYVKYKDPEANPEEAKEAKEQRIKQLMEDLFGNESEIGTALAHKEAVTVPNKGFES